MPNQLHLVSIRVFSWIVSYLKKAIHEIARNNTKHVQGQNQVPYNLGSETWPSQNVKKANAVADYSA